MSRHTIVCLSSQPWDDLWTNKQHIMSRLGRDHRVIYVNFRYQAVVRRLVEGPEVTSVDGVTTLNFFAPGGQWTRLDASNPIRRFLHFDLRRRQLARHLRRQGIEDAILWVYHPGYGPGVAAIPHRLLVYDCVDEYGRFPEYSRHPEWIERRERELCRRADVVFTTAPGLYEDRRALNPDNTYLVHNVGDADHFGRALDPGLAVPADLQQIGGPIIGFIGAISDYKVNVPWVTELARKRRDWNVVMLGPQHLGEAAGIEPLTREPNIHLLGQRPYEDLPAYVKGFDVATIPYRHNDYTARVFPIKFFELLATGKPVVISPLPALRAYWDAVRVAKDAGELINHCAEALADPTAGQEDRRELAGRNTWSSRIAKLMEQIERRL